MISLLISLLFWPLMIASIINSIIGILVGSHWFLYFSAILVIPMSLYLAATPKFMIWGLLFPLCYIGSAILIRKGKRTLAWAVNLPVYAVICWLGYVVI
ncbi:hypothetical protein [Cohnella luojiensis]|uniref:hypothetical protein n=1 Tax=Cohnella luojiensis TaxID=652876 RepID=UPI001430D786|nr:hypothetical protein [Cohnella luojiensis]